MGDVEEIKEELLVTLRQLQPADLTEICSGLSLTVPLGKQGKKSSLMNVLTLHLAADDIAESDDEGLQLFTDLLDTVKGKLEKSNPKGGVKQEGGTGGSKTAAITNDQKQDIHQTLQQPPDPAMKQFLTSLQQSSTTSHLKQQHGGGIGPGASSPAVHIVGSTNKREFKITGGMIGGAEGSVDYHSLCYQMEEGKSLGFTPREIRAGVIKATKTGTSIRKYLERNANATDVEFIEFLKNFYNAKDAETLMDEMQENYQEPKQKEIDFVVKMMGLRDDILAVTKGEECPMPEKVVRKKCLRSISVGFKRDTIRLELRQALKNIEITDNELMKEVNDAVDREAENRKKTKGGVSSNALEVEEEKNGGRQRKVSFSGSDQLENSRRERSCSVGSQDSKVLAEVKKLVAIQDAKLEAHANEMSAVKAQLNELTQYPGQYGGRANSGDYNRHNDNGGDFHDINRGNFNDISRHNYDNKRQYYNNDFHGDDLNYNGNRDGNGRRNGKKGKKPFVNKCKQCLETNAFCTHCLICGKRGHKHYNCPEEKNE